MRQDLFGFFYLVLILTQVALFYLFKMPRTTWLVLFLPVLGIHLVESSDLPRWSLFQLSAYGLLAIASSLVLFSIWNEFMRRRDEETPFFRALLISIVLPCWMFIEWILLVRTLVD